MGRIIAIANQKGGVGKTTTCVNLAASLVALKKRILVVDCDPQGNATMGSGVNKNNIRITLTEVLLEKASILETIVSPTRAGYDLIPSNGQLTNAEVNLLQMPQRERRLQLALAQVSAPYDYVFLDCPPSLSMLTVNALVAAQGVVIPMPCEYFALEGLSSLVNTIQTLRKTVNPHLTIDGLVRTMHDPRSRLAQEVTAQLVKHFGKRLYKTVIPRNVRVAEAPSHGLPVLHYDKQSKGAVAYLEFAAEFLEKQLASKEEKQTVMA